MYTGHSVKEEIKKKYFLHKYKQTGVIKLPNKLHGFSFLPVLRKWRAAIKAGGEAVENVLKCWVHGHGFCLHILT